MHLRIAQFYSDSLTYCGVKVISLWHVVDLVSGSWVALLYCSCTSYFLSAKRWWSHFLTLSNSPEHTSVSLGRERWLVHVGKCKRLPVRCPWSTRSSATPCQGDFPQRWWWRFGSYLCHICCNRSLPCHVLGLHTTNWEIAQGFCFVKGLMFQHPYIWVHYTEDHVLFWSNPAVPVGGSWWV